MKMAIIIGVILLGGVLLAVNVRSEPIPFVKEGCNDIDVNRIGSRINISFCDEYVTINSFFYYPFNDQTYTWGEALSYGVTYDLWKGNRKWGGIINLSDVPQVVKDTGYRLIFQVEDVSDGVNLRYSDNKLWLTSQTYIDWIDKKFPTNHFHILNKTTIYSDLWHDTVEWDPQIESVTIPLGYRNQTAGGNKTGIDDNNSLTDIQTNQIQIFADFSTSINDYFCPYDYDYQAFCGGSAVLSCGNNGCPKWYGSGINPNYDGTYKGMFMNGLSLEFGTWFDDDMTVYAKVKWDGFNPTDMKILRASNVFTWDVSGTNLRFYKWGSASDGTCGSYPLSNFETGVWYDLVQVIHGQTNRSLLYVNGVLVDNESCARGTFDNTQFTLAVGSEQGNDNSFNGTINTIGIWDVGFNQSQIDEMSNIFYNEGQVNYPVLEVNDTYNYVNLTLSTEICGDCEVEGRVKENPLSITDNLINWWCFEGSNKDNLVDCYGDLDLDTTYNITNSNFIAQEISGYSNMGYKFDKEAHGYFEDPNYNLDHLKDRNFTIIFMGDMSRSTKSDSRLMFFEDNNQDGIRMEIKAGNSQIEPRIDMHGVQLGGWEYNYYDYRDTFFIGGKANTTHFCIINDTSDIYCESIGADSLGGSGLRLGHGKYGNINDHFNATLYHVLIYNRSVPSSERTALYNQLINWTTTPYQSFSDGIDEKTFNISNSSNFIQIETKLTSNSTDTPYISNLDLFLHNVNYFHGDAAEDTCSPDGTSDHTFECSDTCNIASPIDFNGNDILITGSGSFVGNGNIRNDGSVRIDGGCIGSW